jgi:hypothetical protein
MAPPDGWLGGYVPRRVVLGRGPEHLVTLGPMEAFPTGVALELTITTRRPVHGPPLMMFGAPDENGMRLGVAYPDGRKWQGGREFPPGPRTEPSAPNVWFSGGGGGGKHYAQRLWLWPLPPEGPVTFALSWRAAGIDETVTVIDGAIFRAAADEAEQLWTPLSAAEEQAIINEHWHRGGHGAPPGTGFRSTQITLGKPDEPPKTD